MQKNPWITIPQPNPRAKMRLFCFTFAGGGTAFFTNWVQSLPLTIELCPIRLPGRESRLREKPYTSIADIVGPVADAIAPMLDKPFLFYGHSMGGVVSYETARELKRRNLAEPQELFISGCRAAHVLDPDPPIHPLPDDEFLAAVAKLNGTPAAVMANKELVQLLLPLLRGDFTAIETYRYAGGEPLNYPLTVFSGDNDPKALVDHMEQWGEHTTARFTHHRMAGDHFFIQNEPFLKLFGQLLGQF